MNTNFGCVLRNLRGLCGKFKNEKSTKIQKQEIEIWACSFFFSRNKKNTDSAYIAYRYSCYTPMTTPCCDDTQFHTEREGLNTFPVSFFSVFSVLLLSTVLC